MNRRTRISLLTATVLAASLALLGLPGSAAADDTTEVLVSVSNCAAKTAGATHERCFARHLVTRRVPSAQADSGRYLRKVDHHAGKGPAHGYTPAQVAKAYAVTPSSAVGATQVVAIVDAFHAPDALAHLNAFNAQYGLPAETADTFRVRNQNGGTTLPAGTNLGWAGETDLDLQAVRGLCHTCKILLVEANDNQSTNLAAAVNAASSFSWATGGAPLPVNIISNSYGSAESASKLASFASAYNHPGKAITVSTGDDGWYGWDHLNDGVDADAAAQYPSVYNTVVAVGGTTLKLKKSGKRSSEVVWNRNGDSNSQGRKLGSQGAAGSGCSEIVTAPSFQSVTKGYSTVGCTPGKRSGVDIAALADPATGYDVYTTIGTNGGGTQTGWFTFGGTSLSSPLVAAMWALAGGPGGTTYPAANLYGHFALKKKRGIYDLKKGGNGLCGNASAKTCKRKIGFDPNTYYNNGTFGIDCKFGWALDGEFNPVSHLAKSATYQCNARKGFDGVSGVGVPAGLDVFKPLV